MHDIRERAAVLALVSVTTREWYRTAALIEAAGSASRLLARDWSGLDPDEVGTVPGTAGPQCLEGLGGGADAETSNRPSPGAGGLAPRRLLSSRGWPSLDRERHFRRCRIASARLSRNPAFSIGPSGSRILALCRCGGRAAGRCYGSPRQCLPPASGARAVSLRVVGARAVETA
jgi:hypothetical protein